MDTLAEIIDVPWESLTLGIVMTGFFSYVLKAWMAEKAEQTKALKAVAATSAAHMQLILETRFGHHANGPGSETEECRKCCDRLGDCVEHITALRTQIERIYADK